MQTKQCTEVLQEQRAQPHGALSPQGTEVVQDHMSYPCGTWIRAYGTCSGSRTGNIALKARQRGHKGQAPG